MDGLSFRCVGQSQVMRCRPIRKVSEDGSALREGPTAERTKVTVTLTMLVVKSPYEYLHREVRCRFSILISIS